MEKVEKVGAGENVWSRCVQEAMLTLALDEYILDLRRVPDALESIGEHRHQQVYHHDARDEQV